MKRLLFIAAIILLALGSLGCGSMYTSLQRPPDTKAMTVNEVIALSNDGVGDSVIIAQIQATQSAFALSNQEIVHLKNSGVSERVIVAMIKTDERSRKGVGSYAYVPYPYYRYPPSYWGLSLDWGHSYGGYIGGHHLSGHAVGGHGISRGHSGHISRPRSFGRR